MAPRAFVVGGLARPTFTSRAHVTNPSTTLVNMHTHVSVWILLAALGGYGWLVQQLGAINTRLSVMESESALRASALENRLGGLDHAFGWQSF